MWPHLFDNAYFCGYNNSMRKLSSDKRVSTISALIEGCSVNSTARMCGVAKLTVLRLLADVGTLCRDHHDKHVRGLQPKRIQADEIWSFIHCKAKNVPAAKSPAPGAGDSWVWVAIDSDSKLVLSYQLGSRTDANALEFMLDLASRVTNEPQLTTDGLAAYPLAVREAFGQYVNYAQLIKVYRATRPENARYSPAECISCKIEYVEGAPDPAHISTSYVERQNLTMRMSMRRFTRLTNAFSKKIENHAHAVALHYWYYNFARKHKTLGTTPAVVAGLAERPMTIADLVAMLENAERLWANGGRINRADRS